jgi:hypothetical protein
MKLVLARHIFSEFFSETQEFSNRIEILCGKEMIAQTPNTMQLWFMDRIALILQELEDLIKVV